MSIMNHFRKDEMPFVERALEMLEQAEQKHSMRLTDFLDPRQFFILQSLTSQVTDVEVRSFGGYDGAERVRVLLYPSYVEPTEDDFGVILLQLAGDQRFVKLEHRDVMGAVLNIGVKRDKFGDILIGEGVCQVVVAKEMADYVRLQLTHVHRIPVRVQQVALHEVIATNHQFSEKVVTVPSARVDAVLGEVYHLSRAKALVPIRAGRLKVNWKVVEDPSLHVEAGDLLSLQGFGRVRILAVDGPTKSGRLRITVGQYV